MWSVLMQEAHFHSAIVLRDGTAQFDHHMWQKTSFISMSMRNYEWHKLICIANALVRILNL